MTSRYAENTSVPADRSRAEIERTLERYGADEFMYGWTSDGAVIGFRMNGRVVKLTLPLPDRADEQFHTTPTGRKKRNEDAALAAWEQACRQSWRALALVVKAKLEAVAANISTFEREFLADTILPSGETVSEWLEPQIERAITEKRMPHKLPLMLGPGGES